MYKDMASSIDGRRGSQRGRVECQSTHCNRRWSLPAGGVAGSTGQHWVGPKTFLIVAEAACPFG